MEQMKQLGKTVTDLRDEKEAYKAQVWSSRLSDTQCVVDPYYNAVFFLWNTCWDSP